MKRGIGWPCPICGIGIDSPEMLGIHVSNHNTMDGRRRNWNDFLRRKRWAVWNRIHKEKARSI